MKQRYAHVRVVASPDGLLVLDAERRALPGIIGVNIAVRPGKPPVMQLNLLAQAFDVVGKPTFMAMDPAGGPARPVKSIEFWDNTGIAFPEPPVIDLPMQPPPGGAKPVAPVEATPAPSPVAAVVTPPEVLPGDMNGAQVMPPAVKPDGPGDANG